MITKNFVILLQNVYNKNMFKKLIQKSLQRYAKKYLKTHSPQLIVVTGSVGKTSTKTAIATVLGERYRVRMQDGNHNTEMSVPLAILGIEYPEDIRSVGAWISVFQAARLRISEPKDVDVIVQELGTDRPGDVGHFGKYLKPDVAVVTAVSPEHMEYFGSIEAVAKEELAVTKFSKYTIINRDDIDESYAAYATTNSISTYGLDEKAEYHIELDVSGPLEGRMGRLITPDWDPISVNLQLIGDHSVKAAVAAGSVAAKLGLSAEQVAVGMAKITAVPGRMQLLSGANETCIIDDSYNSSPLALSAALKTLQSIDAPKRVAIIGSMNELGGYSAEAHQKIAELCDPSKLEFVVTVGADAGTHFAPAAKERGCQVKVCDSPYEAGGFVRGLLEPGMVVLVKGSQNRVFTEESIKILLHDINDEQKLVRQSPSWMRKKQSQFQADIKDTDD